MAISFRPNWNDHFFLNKLKWIPFHSGRNEMFISAIMKWNSFHFDQTEMVISFRPKWNVIFLIVLRNMRPGQLSWKSGKIQLAIWSSVLSRTQLLSPSVALLAKLVFCYSLVWVSNMLSSTMKWTVRMPGQNRARILPTMVCHWHTLLLLLQYSQVRGHRECVGSQQWSHVINLLV